MQDSRPGQHDRVSLNPHQFLLAEVREGARERFAHGADFRGEDALGAVELEFDVAGQAKDAGIV